MNGPQEKLAVKPKRRSVAAALAAGKFGEAGENNPPSGNEGVSPIPQFERGHDVSDEININTSPSITPVSPPANRDFAPIKTGKDDQQTDKPTHQGNQIQLLQTAHPSIDPSFADPEIGLGAAVASAEFRDVAAVDKGPQNDKPTSIIAATAGALSGQTSDRGRVKNVPSTPRAGRLERGQSQAMRRNRTFRASDAEFDILFDILEQVRRSRRLTRSQANRVETSTVIRAALRHVAKAPVDAILDEIIERGDFSGT